MLLPGLPAQAEGTVEAVERSFRGRPMLRVAIGDGSYSTLVLRFFHFRSQQMSQFATGTRLRIYGTPRPGQQGLEIVHPSYRVLGGADDASDPALSDKLDPIYPAIDGIGPAVLRKLIAQALQRLPDERALELLPAEVLAREPLCAGLPSLREALLTLHRPPQGSDLQAGGRRPQAPPGTHPAQRRLALEELLAHHLSLRRQRIAMQAYTAPALRGGKRVTALRKQLPFALTGAQERVFAEIRDDLAKPIPMLRLVQGDVGSGKTVVAAMAAMLALFLIRTSINDR